MGDIAILLPQIDDDKGRTHVVVPLSLFDPMFKMCEGTVAGLKAYGAPEEVWPDDVKKYIAEINEEHNAQRAARRKKQ